MLQQMAASNHHFVPQFLIRRFAESSAALGVRTYLTRKNKYVSNASIRKQAKRRNFYQKQEFESALSQMEGDAASMINRICDRQAIPRHTSQEMDWLRVFVLVQLARTPKQIDSENRIRDMIKDGATVNGPVPERLKPFAFHDPGTSILQSITAAVNTLPLVRDLRCKLLHASGSDRYLLSDNPVVLHNQFAREIKCSNVASGLACAGVKILFPIDPRYAIVLFDPSCYKVGGRSAASQYVKLTDSDVKQFNRFQIANSIHQVFLSPETSCDWVAQETIEMREVLSYELERSEILKAPDGENVVHWRRECLPMDMSLSVVKRLPSARKHLIAGQLGNRDPERYQLQVQFLLDNVRQKRPDRIFSEWYIENFESE